MCKLYYSINFILIVCASTDTQLKGYINADNIFAACTLIESIEHQEYFHKLQTFLEETLFIQYHSLMDMKSVKFERRIKCILGAFSKPITIAKGTIVMDQSYNQSQILKIGWQYLLIITVQETKMILEESQFATLRVPCLFRFSQQSDEYAHALLILTGEKIRIQRKNQIKDLKNLQFDEEQDSVIVHPSIPICFQPQGQELMIIFNPHCHIRTLLQLSPRIQQHLQRQMKLPVLKVPSEQIQQAMSVYGEEKFVHCGTFNTIQDCAIKIENCRNGDRISILVQGVWIQKPLLGAAIRKSQSYHWPDGDVFYFWKSFQLLEFEQIVHKIQREQISRHNHGRASGMSIEKLQSNLQFPQERTHQRHVPVSDDSLNQAVGMDGMDEMHDSGVKNFSQNSRRSTDKKDDEGTGQKSSNKKGLQPFTITRNSKGMVDSSALDFGSPQQKRKKMDSQERGNQFKSFSHRAQEILYGSEQKQDLMENRQARFSLNKGSLSGRRYYQNGDELDPTTRAKLPRVIDLHSIHIEKIENQGEENLEQVLKANHQKIAQEEVSISDFEAIEDEDQESYGSYVPVQDSLEEERPQIGPQKIAARESQQEREIQKSEQAIPQRGIQNKQITSKIQPNQTKRARKPKQNMQILPNDRKSRRNRKKSQSSEQKVVAVPKIKKIRKRVVNIKRNTIGETLKPILDSEFIEQIKALPVPVKMKKQKEVEGRKQRIRSSKRLNAGLAQSQPIAKTLIEEKASLKPITNIKSTIKEQTKGKMYLRSNKKTSKANPNQPVIQQSKSSKISQKKQRLKVVKKGTGSNLEKSKHFHQVSQECEIESVQSVQEVQQSERNLRRPAKQTGQKKTKTFSELLDDLIQRQQQEEQNRKVRGNWRTKRYVTQEYRQQAEQKVEKTIKMLKTNSKIDMGKYLKNHCLIQGGLCLGLHSDSRLDFYKLQNFEASVNHSSKNDKNLRPFNYDTSVDLQRIVRGNKPQELYPTTFDVHPSQSWKLLTNSRTVNQIFEFDLNKNKLVGSWKYQLPSTKHLLASESMGTIQDIKHYKSSNHSYIAITSNCLILGDTRTARAEGHVLKSYNREKGMNFVAVNPTNPDQVAVSSQYGAVRLYDIRKVTIAKNKFEVGSHIQNLQCSSSSQNQLLLSFKDRISVLPTCDALYESKVKLQDRDDALELSIPKRQIGKYENSLIDSLKLFCMSPAHYNFNSSQIVSSCGQYLMRWRTSDKQFHYNRLPQTHRSPFYCDFFNESVDQIQVVYGCEEGFWLQKT